MNDRGHLVRRSAIAGALSFLAAAPVFAQEVARTLPEADVINQIQIIRDQDFIPLSRPLIIEGDYVFNGWFIVADRIVFKPGARLIFSRQAMEGRSNFFVVAREMVSEDPNAPGTITYERPAPNGAAALSGQAPTGRHATEDGSRGGVGSAGAQGNDGPRGFGAPTLTITVLSVPGSGPVIDFTGGLGGQGGQGQRGGDGGNGAKGTPASQSMFDCKAGGGRGGDGGQGGQGGVGGTGGQGGEGGTITVIAPADLLPSLSQKFRVVVAGGDGGAGGLPGPGGNGGAAGPGGQDARPYCGGGSAGNPGAAGGEGRPGSSGQTGVHGDFFVGEITAEMFEQVY